LHLINYINIGCLYDTLNSLIFAYQFFCSRNLNVLQQRFRFLLEITWKWNI